MPLARYFVLIFARISSSAGQNSYLPNSSAVIHFASACSSSFISCPSSSFASKRLSPIVTSGYSCSTLTKSFPTVISTSSSSLHSLFKASSRLSPDSTFPPTNSHSNARDLFSGLWQIRNLSPRHISAATTSTITNSFNRASNRLYSCGILAFQIIIPYKKRVFNSKILTNIY